MTDNDTFLEMANNDTFLELTILAEGEHNGEKIYIRAGDIRRIAKTKMKSDSTYMLTATGDSPASRMIEGSVLFLHNFGGIVPGIPPIQTVQELPAQVMAALGGAVPVAKVKIAKVA